MAPYRKAIVAVVGAVVLILALFEVEVDEETAGAVISLLTGLAVYAIPNN